MSSSRRVTWAIAVIGVAGLCVAASCAHRARTNAPPPETLAIGDVPGIKIVPTATPTPEPAGGKNTIAPFPVPGDTSRVSALRRKMMNVPRSGVTTVAPLPPPVPSQPGPQGQESSPGTTTAVVELPEPIEQYPPRYPEGFCKGQPLSATVLVMAHVLADGTVGDTRVAQSIPTLDEEAVACVKRWRFKPARDETGPTAVWVAVPIRWECR